MGANPKPLRTAGHVLRGYVTLSDAQCRRAWAAHEDGVTWSELGKRFAVHPARLRERVEVWVAADMKKAVAP